MNRQRNGSGDHFPAIMWLGALCVLAAFYSGKAAAADQGQAYAACSALVAEKSSDAYCVSQHNFGDKFVSGSCVLLAGSTSISGNYQAQIQCKNLGDAFYPVDTPGNFPYNGSCVSRPPLGSMVVASNDPQMFDTCYQGCSYVDNDGTASYYTVDGVTYVNVTGWIAEAQTCNSTSAPVTPPPDSDGDGVSDANDAFPTDPGESVDTDGDGIGDNADKPCGSDPTNPNCSDDGQGDETDNEASGGGTCSAPPVCSGDGIQCNLLFQAWATRCASEKTNDLIGDGGGSTPGDGSGDGTVAGGSTCSQPYTCSGGDPKLCAALNEQHQIRCALAGDGTSDDDWGEELPVSDAFGVSSPAEGFSFDDSGWLGGGGECPAVIPGVDAGEVDLEPLCNGASVLGTYVLILMFLHGVHILGQAIARNS